MQTITKTSDNKTSRETNQIRISARAKLGLGAMQHCPTCTRSITDPYRRTDAEGRIVEGCVDAAHRGQDLGSASQEWHDRQEAREIRRATLHSLIKVSA